VAVAVLVALSGCTGPTVPLTIGQQRSSLDLVLGAITTVQKAPTPSPVLPVPGLPGPAFPPSAEPSDRPARIEPTSTASVPPARIPCPTADPTSPLAGVATPTVVAPPVPATYAYRTTTTLTSGTHKAVTAGRATVLVGNVTKPDAQGSFDYDLTVKVGTASTVSTYRIITASSTAQVDPAGSVNGLLGPTVPEVPLTPEPPLLIGQIPLVPSRSYHVAGGDARTTESYTSTVGPKIKVDACGQFLDSVGVGFTDGTVVTAGTSSTFTSTLALGTSYGGIPLFWKTTVSNAQAGATVTSEVTATINQVPR
jgi:hypothetical protein